MTPAARPSPPPRGPAAGAATMAPPGARRRRRLRRRRGGGGGGGLVPTDPVSSGRVGEGQLGAWRRRLVSPMWRCEGRRRWSRLRCAPETAAAAMTYAGACGMTPVPTTAARRSATTSTTACTGWWRLVRAGGAAVTGGHGRPTAFPFVGSSSLAPNGGGQGGPVCAGGAEVVIRLC
jgi:hypothetical protein